MHLVLVASYFADERWCQNAKRECACVCGATKQHIFNNSWNCFLFFNGFFMASFIFMALLSTEIVKKLIIEYHLNKKPTTISMIQVIYQVEKGILGGNIKYEIPI